jgi:hypothetical protein
LGIENRKPKTENRKLKIENWKLKIEKILSLSKNYQKKIFFLKTTKKKILN